MLTVNIHVYALNFGFPKWQISVDDSRPESTIVNEAELTKIVLFESTQANELQDDLK